MKIYLSLARLYLGSFYNLPGKKAAGDGSVKDPDARRTATKAALKTIGMIVLILLLVADIGVLFVMLNLGLYRGLAAAGMQGLLVLYAGIMATALTLVVGFMTSLSTYYLNDMELQLLAMPIPPRPLLAAKFTAVYASEAAVSLFFMGTAAVIFGLKEQPHPLFYVWALLAGFLLPLIPLAASYLIQIPLLTFARFLKNRRVIMILGGIMGISFGLVFNLYMQGTMSKLARPEAMAALAKEQGSVVLALGKAYPPAQLAWKAMSDPASAGAVGAMAGMALLCLAAPALVIFFLGRTYADSLVGFNESRLRKLTAAGADAFISGTLKAGSPFISMVKREVALMNREPMYLLNGPFIVILMPIIVGIMFAVQGEAMMAEPEMAAVVDMVRGGLGLVIVSLAGAFLGSGTSITCTALSRDAKALPFMKSLPVSAGSYMLAKLVHGIIFAGAGSIVGAGLLAWVLKLSPGNAIAGVAVSFALSSLVNMGGLWLDTANPRLSWDNPIAAMKQNPNSVIVMLGAMGLFAGAGWLSYRLMLGTGAFIFWFGVVPAVIFFILLAVYPKYAARRLEQLEA